MNLPGRSIRQRHLSRRVLLAGALVATTAVVGIVTPRAEVSAHALPGYRTMEYARHLVKPTAMAFAPDGRLLVTEKEGTVALIDAAGVLREDRVLSLPVDSYRERGLLGIAFDPAFDTNRHVYLYYSSSVGGCHHVVSRFRMSGDLIVPESERQLIDIGNCGSGGHNGGALHIGLDGKLIIQTGEQNRSEHSQTLGNLFGKVLRLNLDGTIPTDNPFYGEATGRNRAIWALGFRNPFSGGVDPVTGDLFVNDVGEYEFEEVNHVVAGANYGWPMTEGPFSATRFPDLAAPLHAYAHGAGEFEGCAIVGGTFYRSTTDAFPADFDGDWLYADYCNEYIHRLDRATGVVSEVIVDATLVADIDIGPDGNIYYLDRVGGPLKSFVRSIEYTNLPGIAKQPAPVVAAEGTEAIFRVVASGDGPHSFQWFRNGAPLAGENTSVLEFTATAADDGAAYSVEVANDAGSLRSNEERLTIDSTANTAPDVVIGAPTDNLVYRGGDVISFAGSATDAQDGPLGDDALSWEVVFHHAEHTHPFLEEISGAAGSFVVPNDDETATDVFYRVHLTATDSGGAEATTFVDIVPKVVKMRLLTEPRGLPVELNGQPTPTTAVITSVTGVKRQLGAPAAAQIAGVDWEFDTWLDSGMRTRNVVTQKGTRTYVANYRVAGGVVGTGSGLQATYYDNADFTAARKTRRDRVIRFAWRNSSPNAAIAPSSFSARWQGALTGQFTERYTISADVRGDVKVTVGGRVVIDASAATLTTVSAEIDLTAGVSTPILVEYSNPGNIGVVKLHWSSASTPISLIPSSQLSY